MTPIDTKTSQVNLRLSPALKARAEQAAARDRRSLTSLIEKLLSDHLQNRVTLETWHRVALSRFEHLAVTRKQSAILLPKRYRTLSFSINSATGSEINPQQLVNILSRIPAQMSDILRPNMFHVYTREQLAPTYISNADEISTRDLGEILECAIFPDTSELGTVEFWCVTPSGFASSIRPYREDDPNLPSSAGHEPTTWFWPYVLIRDLYELVLHAILLSDQIEAAETVEFRCEWWGLQGREIADAEPGISWTPGQISKEGHCITKGEWTTTDIKHLPETVSALAAPVLRLFNPGFDCSPTWVHELAKRFRKLG